LAEFFAFWGDALTPLKWGKHIGFQHDGYAESDKRFRLCPYIVLGGDALTP